MNLREIEQLYSLKEKGIITEEEFNIKKQQLLTDKSFKLNENLKKNIIYTFLGIVLFLFFYYIVVVFFITKEYTSDKVRCNYEAKFCYTLEGNKPITGLVKDFKDGLIVSEAHFKNGKLHGDVKLYYSNGNKKTFASYKDGKLDGSYTSYYENGLINESISYKNNKKDGVYIKNLKDGGSVVIMYTEDKVQNYSKYNKKGTKIQSIICFNEKCDVEDFYDNGNIKQKLVCENKNATGEVKLYYENKSSSGNSLKDECNFLNDKLNGVFKSYYANGKIKEDGRIDNGKLSGTIKRYFISGKLESQEEYENNMRNGDFKLFYESGKIKAEGHYKNDKLYGTFKAFYPNGNLIYEALYKDDILSENADVYQYDGTSEFAFQAGGRKEGHIKMEFDRFRVEEPLSIMSVKSVCEDIHQKLYANDDKNSSYFDELEADNNDEKLSNKNRLGQNGFVITATCRIMGNPVPYQSCTKDSEVVIESGSNRQSYNGYGIPDYFQILSEHFDFFIYNGSDKFTFYITIRDVATQQTIAHREVGPYDSDRIGN